MKKIYAYIIAAAAFINIAPGLNAQVVTDKYVTGPNSDGTYTLTLESYVTGRVDTQETEKATDFLILLDYSGSMSSATGKDPVFNASTTKKTETSGVRVSETKSASTATAGYWTYSNTAYGNGSGTANLQWYYREGTAAPYTYYPVYRVANLANSDGSANNCRALYIMKGSTKWYLQPDGTIAKTYVKTNTSNSKKLFVGTLYKGWSYATYADADGNQTYTGAYDNKAHYYSRGLTANATGTANSQYYYYDADNVLYTTSYYYPVMKANNLPDANGGNTARAFYVERSGVRKYLNLQGKLVDTYDKTITTDNRTITFATLYRGWTYNDVVAALNDGTTTGDAGGHWVKYSTDALGQAAYYPLQKETLSDANKKYQVFFIDRNGVKRYLRPYGTSTSPVSYTAGTKVSLFFGSLFTVKQWDDYSRYEGLKRAVAAFAEGVSKHAKEKGITHRIALLAFGSSYWVPQLSDDGKTTGNPIGNAHHPGSKKILAAYNLEADVRNINKPYLNPVSGSGTNTRGARVLVNFQTMYNATDATVATTSLNNILAEFAATPTLMHDATDLNFGMALAQSMLEREWRGASSVRKDFDDNGTVSRYEYSYLSTGYDEISDYKRPKSIIVVSDGSWNTYDFNYNSSNPAPGQTSRTSNSELNAQARQNAINRANAIKSTYTNATIYCIHVNTNNINTYEKQIATSTAHCIKAEDYGKALIDAMLTIVNKIDVADINLTSTAVVQDIVTKEFSVPTAANNSNIKLYTANCTGVDGEGELKFGSSTAFSGTITRTTDTDGTTKISVTGFDYAANWCGLHANGSYEGKKLILKIPIVPDPNLVGGTFYTNTTQSIILDKPGGKKVADFPRPQLTFDYINLRIVKKGLLEDDSAVFAIYRKPKTTGAVYESTPYMTVLLSGVASGDDVEAQITGLNANYHYMIKETWWSWRYTPDTSEISTEEQFQNPFVFTNTLDDDGAPKNGEDVVHNVFTF